MTIFFLKMVNEAFIIEFMEMLKYYDNYRYNNITKTYTIKIATQSRLLMLIELCQRHNIPFQLNNGIIIRVM